MGTLNKAVDYFVSQGFSKKTAMKLYKCGFSTNEDLVRYNEGHDRVGRIYRPRLVNNDAKPKLQNDFIMLRLVGPDTVQEIYDICEKNNLGLKVTLNDRKAIEEARKFSNMSSEARKSCMMQVVALAMEEGMTMIDLKNIMNDEYECVITEKEIVDILETFLNEYDMVFQLQSQGKEPYPTEILILVNFIRSSNYGTV